MAWSQADKRFEEPEAENAPAEATGPSSDADKFFGIREITGGRLRL
jgi:hypothetical protein